MTELVDAEIGVREPLQRIGRVPLLAPLRYRDFRLVWFGESISLLGDQFHYVALSWLVLGLTGSGLALGTVLLAASLPRGAFLLVGGALSDRISPRTLMLGSNVVRAVITTMIAILVLGGRIEIWHLLVAGALFGTVDAVFFPAIGTIVARLVPEDRLGPANSVLQGTQQLMSTVGPALAGLAIATIGVGTAFVIDAASFAVAAVAIWLVRSAGMPPAAPTDDQPAAEEPASGPASEDLSAVDGPSRRASVLSEMFEGARAVMGDPVMRMLVLLSTAFNLAFTGPVVVGLPWLVQFRFDGDAALLGLLFAAFGGGSLIGVLLAGTLPRTRRLGYLLVSVATLLGVGLVAIGLASAPAVGVILMLIGTGTGYINVSIITWTQVRTEPHLLGRTMSFLMLGSVVAAPLSLAVAGAVVDLEATALFVGAGVLVIVTALAGFATSLPRRMV
jgi:predicted MFS family arabinose efflux permease